MTHQELYLAIRSWITQILVTEGLETIEITETHDSGPKLTGAYIAVGYDGPKQNLGQTKSEFAYNATNDNLERDIVQHRAITRRIWEVNGNGDRLESLCLSLSRQDIIDLLYTAGVGVFTVGDVIDMPRDIEGQHVKESFVDIVFGVAGYVVETADLVESVGIMQL